MIPLEPASLSIGITALFTTCIQCFEYFKAASNLRRDFDILLLKLEIEEERLLVWGETLPVGSDEGSEPSSFGEDVPVQDLTQRCLYTIRSLLEDTEGLKSKYGCRRVVTGPTTSFESLSSNALKRLRARLGKGSKDIGIVGKTKWAIHDAAKFEKLIVNVRDLVTTLVQRDIGAGSRHCQKIQDDIASMTDHISKLQLISEACADAYPQWSDVASRAIDASDIGTANGFLEEKRFEIYQDENIENVPGAEYGNRIAFGEEDEVYLHRKTQVFFVLTEHCRNENTDAPCDPTSVGKNSFTQSSGYVSPSSYLTGSSPGLRIAKEIKPQLPTSLDFERGLPDFGPQVRNRSPCKTCAPIRGVSLAQVYVYCPPCVCQVATALSMWSSMRECSHLDVHIRVDHRLESTCSLSSSSVDAIASLIDHIKDLERMMHISDFQIAQLKAIDRQWLEQSLHDYEEESQVNVSSPADRLARIFEPHEEEDTCAAIIILGEADFCTPLMTASPFPPFPPGRMPLPTHIYKLSRWKKRQDYTERQRWSRRFLGTYTPSQTTTPKKRRPTEQSPIQGSGEAEPPSKRVAMCNSP